jgi:uncharacterized RDD family membrane protein YckC
MAQPPPYSPPPASPPPASPPPYGPPPYGQPPISSWSPPVAGPAPGISYAGFWIRFIAYVIDGFIVGLAFWVVLLVGGIAVVGSTAADRTGGAAIGLGSVLVVAWLVAAVLWKPWWWSHGGQTPAYKVLGLRVVRARDGGPVSFGPAFVRFIGYLINDIVLGIPIGFIWAAFDAQKQGWHDKLAGTVVIRM